MLEDLEESEMMLEKDFEHMGMVRIPRKLGTIIFQYLELAYQSHLARADEAGVVVFRLAPSLGLDRVLTHSVALDYPNNGESLVLTDYAPP